MVGLWLGVRAARSYLCAAAPTVVGVFAFSYDVDVGAAVLVVVDVAVVIDAVVWVAV